MAGSKKTHTSTSLTDHRRSVAVSNKEALVFGAVASLVVLVVTLIATSAWRSYQLLGYALLYSIIAFVACAGGALILNAVVAKQSHEDNPDYPVMK